MPGDECRIALGRYRHWKGGVYRAIGVGILTEHHDLVVVIYVDEHSTDPPMYYVRPLADFTGPAGPDAVPRFEYVDDAEASVVPSAL